MSQPKDYKLTGRQTLFAKHYVDKPNATQAAIKAGYSSKGATVRGCKLLAKDSIRAEIARLQALGERKGQYTAEFVLQALQDILELALRKGKEQTAIRALELLGRHKGLFTDAKDAGTAMPAINVYMPQPKAIAPGQPRLRLTGTDGDNGNG